MIIFHEVDDLEDIMQLWNNEMGFIYPIAYNVFKQNVINYQDKYVYGAYDDNKLVGFIIGKTYNGHVIETYLKYGWISLIYVSKKFRRQGIGTKLLKFIEEKFTNKDTIIIGRDIFNFFPGIPVDFDNLSDSWFINRGYTAGGYTHDLINRNPKIMPIRNKFKFQVCSLLDKDELLTFMKKNFDGRWFYEVYQYFKNGGNGNEYVIVLDKDKVIAFSRVNDRTFQQIHYNTIWYPRFQNLGGIGPLGVDRDYRGRGLGYDIVGYGINTLISRNISEIIIDWTSLLEFYQQFGFEVWKSFRYMLKKG